MARQKSIALSDQMRGLLATCGQSRYSIAKTTGISQSTLSKFMAGHGIETSNLDKLASHLDWTIQQRTTDGE